MAVLGSFFTSCSSHIFYKPQIISELFSFKYVILFSCQNSQLSAGGLFVCITAISKPKFLIFVLPTAMRMGSLKLCPTIKRNYLWHVYFFVLLGTCRSYHDSYLILKLILKDDIATHADLVIDFTSSDMWFMVSWNLMVCWVPVGFYVCAKGTIKGLDRLNANHIVVNYICWHL